MSRPNKHGVDKDGFIIEDGFFGDMDMITGEEDTEPGNFTRTELRYTAEELVEELRESKNGSSVSVTGLLKECGYDIPDYSKRDIKVLRELLLKLSKANKIKLTEKVGCSGDDPDDSVYTIDNLKAQIKCPYCGSTDTATIIYGMPAFSERMQEKLEKKKWALGGCCISLVKVGKSEVDISPKRLCNKCKKEFGTAPVLYDKATFIGEDYRDIVTSLKFSIGGYFEGHTEIVISKNEKGAVVNIENRRLGLSNDEFFDSLNPKQITRLKWDRILNKLYNEIYLHEWKKNYEDPNVLDGTSWELEITMTNRRKRTYSGINDYPPYWNELKKIFREYTRF